jgi:hypothetical protein
VSRRVSTYLLPMAEGGWRFFSRMPFRRPYTTVASVVWLVVVAVVYLAPAVLHGASLGPFDFLGIFGLGQVPGDKPYSLVALDQIMQMQPWTSLDWLQVHSGHLPLWNPHSGMGMPLGFNFQSAPFAVPTVVGYLVPLRYAYTVAVLVKMVIAGTGVLFLCRVLGLSNLSATFAAMVFELSGSFTGWLGWPQAGALCWLGWIIGATILVTRTDHLRPGRAVSVTLLAAVLAASFYAGHPESEVFIFECLALVAIVYLAGCIVGRDGGIRKALSPAFDLVIACVASVALAAPLLLPGIPVIAGSARQGGTGYVGLPKSYLINIVAPGYFGFPIAGHTSYGPIAYYEAANYVGAIVLILAILAVIFQWRQRATQAMAVVAVVMGATLFVPQFSRALGQFPVAKDVAWGRVAMPLDLALAVLAGLGLEAIRANGYSLKVLSRLSIATASVAVALGIVWLRDVESHPHSAQGAAQAQSLVMPFVSVMTASVLVVMLAYLRTRGRGTRGSRLRGFGPEIACVALMAVEAIFLLTATPNLWSSSNSFFSTTPAELQLQRAVDNERVGDEACTSLTGLPSDIGILPDANGVYGVSELSVYDPVLPQEYFNSWSRLTGAPVAHTALGMFCPSLTSAALARHYGVSYVLAPVGATPPRGMRQVEYIPGVVPYRVPNGRVTTGELLYRVPGGGVATLETRTQPIDSAAATRVPIEYPTPAQMRIHTVSKSASTLYVHVTDFPGWHVTIDGQPAPFMKWDGLMIRILLPRGSHVVELTYLPSTFTLGLLLSTATVVSLLSWIALEMRRNRRQPTYPILEE